MLGMSGSFTQVSSPTLSMDKILVFLNIFVYSKYAASIVERTRMGSCHAFGVVVHYLF